jgi:hypothetical protein
VTIKSGAVESFGEEISCLMFRGTMVKKKGVVEDTLASVMILDVDVFGPLVMHGVLDEGKRPLGVKENGSRLRERLVKTMEKGLEADGFSGCSGGGHVFGLCGRESNGRLLFGDPGDSSAG